jgi:1,4-dihydroxy-2-naphthoate octaprenyltransferase
MASTKWFLISVVFALLTVVGAVIVTATDAPSWSVVLLVPLVVFAAVFAAVGNKARKQERSGPE